MRSLRTEVGRLIPRLFGRRRGAPDATAPRSQQNVAAAPPLAPVEPPWDEPAAPEPAPPLVHKPALLSPEQRRMLAAMWVAAALAIVVAAIAVLRLPVAAAPGSAPNGITPSDPKTPDAVVPVDLSSRPKLSDRFDQPGSAKDGGVEGAQRVVLYEEVKNGAGGRRFVGTAVWHADKAAAAFGRPDEVVVRADIEIPNQKISMRWWLRHNEDDQLPASHIVEMMFTLPPDFPHGGIATVPGVLMKPDELTRGVALAGLPVKVTTNFFLIGLSATDADLQRNIGLLKERAWIDIPLVYADGQRAIIALEKGPPGDRLFSDAFASWGQ